MKLWDTPTCLMQRQCLAPNKEGFVPYHARQCGMWDVLEHLKTRIPVPPCKSPPLRCVCLGYTFVSTCFTSFHLQPFTFVMFPQLELVASVFPSAIHVILVLLSISFVFSCFSSLHASLQGSAARFTAVLSLRKPASFRPFSSRFSEAAWMKASEVKKDLYRAI